MPVEVRELVIRAVDDSEKKSTARTTADKKASKTDVSEGLERLLRLIKNKNER
jgi:hypothetical protein